MAANVSLKPPGRFDFKRPDAWPKWKRRFQQYLTATGLDKEEDARKINTLLYCLGEESEDVLTSTNITEADRKQYDSVVEKFDSFFNVRRNVIYERARFNRRDQLEGESAEQYITCLYSLIETCEYGTFKEEMLRDRLVVGIRDAAMSQKLQMDAELTLEKAKKAIRQKEAVYEQQRELQGDGSAKDPIVVDEVRHTRWRGQKTKGGSSYRPQPKRGGTRGSQPCMRCGKTRHPTPDKCPALSATCRKCNRKGHYASQCLSKTVVATTQEVEAGSVEEASLGTVTPNQQVEADSVEEVFLGTVTSSKDKAWSVNIRLQGKEIVFKMDTGAEVTVISEKEYRTLERTKLEKPSRVLYGPARQPLEVLGQFSERLTYGEHSHSEDIFVVRDLHNNLLGLTAITGLHLIQRVNATHQGSVDILKRFPKVFTGLGTLGGDYTIRLKEDAHPFALYTPRRVPFSLRSQVQDELTRMEALGVISKVKDPTPWCAGMVVVPKKTGAVRICVDLKPLNESVLREVHPIPRVDEALAQLTGATIFTKLDANSGFWQIPLSPESRPLTTFITPVGRYHFNKLPFGISSAPELFQRRMSTILEGLEGVVCLIDDVLVIGKDEAEHDTRLMQVLERLESVGVTLNREKCAFRQSSVKFLGHLIGQDGVRADPEKTSAIRDMETPQSVSDLRRFLGMVNQLGKFSPQISELTQPLRELLSTKRAWLWGPEQEQAFGRVKEELLKPTTLALYNPQAELKISADASSFGLGAVLLQKENDNWKPVAYASRSMSETERRYAQIEKEALAVTWACEKFTDYILGRKFLIESDHKPLIPLLNTKQLDSMPPRILRFRLRLARYDYSVCHVPGKHLYTADTLSRAPVAGDEDDTLQKEVEVFVNAVVERSLPATEQRLNMYRCAQEQDPVCQQVIEHCRKGWPRKGLVNPDIAPYWKVRGSLTVCNRLLLYDHRIVVPKSLQEETKQKIHAGHQGIQRCRARVAASVWWPGVSQQIAQTVQQCAECAKNSTPNKEPLMTSQLPEYPWQVVGTDLFEIDGVHYLLTVDYFSRYPEVIKLTSTTSAAVIKALKSVFSRHGIPETVRSDNGPQYSSQEFARFASSYEFNHVTSSPRFPQSNGQVERTVQTVKRLLKRSNDPYLALLSYRATPLPWCDLSPAQLSMGRRIRTPIPQTNKLLVPNWAYLKTFREKNKQFKQSQKSNFDKRHRARELSPIPDNTDVWITSESQPVQGKVISTAGSPRSYVVSTPSGEIHRNRSHLNIVPDKPEPEHEETRTDLSTKVIMTRSRTGTEIRPPERLA